MTGNKIIELKEKSSVDGVYAILAKSEIVEYDNGKFFTLSVRDKTGKIGVTHWAERDEDLESIYNSLATGDTVRIVGYVSTNKKTGELYISVSSKYHGRIEKVQANPRDFVPGIEDIPWLQNTEEDMLREIDSQIATVNNPYITKLLNLIFHNPDFREKFTMAPASISNHSAALHGLLHHTLNVLHIALSVAERYPSIDRELLLAGALLHDIGKVKEYEISTTLSESTEGGLLGHIYLGAEMLDGKIAEIPEFPNELRMKLVHIILSHHGRIEQGFGSAKDPMFAEALIVALADYMDSQVYNQIEKIETKKTKDSSQEFAWDPHIGWIYLH